MKNGETSSPDNRISHRWSDAFGEKGVCTEWGAIPHESVTVKPERDKSDTYRTRRPPAETGMRDRVFVPQRLPEGG